MINVYDFYILGLPIDTEYGQCHFLTVKDYPIFFQHLNGLAITKESIIYKYYCDEEHDNTETIKVLQELSLFDMIMISKDIFNMYDELFSYVFQNDKFFENITEEKFITCRNLLLKMNVIKENIVNPNPEIQRWIEKEQGFNQTNDCPTTFADVVSSVAMGSGLTYDQINNMTLHQLYTSFHRIVKIKAYDTSTLFATVSAERVDIEVWCGHIDLFVKEQHGMSKEQYNKKRQEIGI